MKTDSCIWHLFEWSIPFAAGGMYVSHSRSCHGTISTKSFYAGIVTWLIWLICPFHSFNRAKTNRSNCLLKTRTVTAVCICTEEYIHFAFIYFSSYMQRSITAFLKRKPLLLTSAFALLARILVHNVYENKGLVTTSNDADCPCSLPRSHIIW